MPPPDEQDTIQVATPIGQVKFTGRDVIMVVLMLSMLGLTVWEHYARSNEHDAIFSIVSGAAMLQRSQIASGETHDKEVITAQRLIQAGIRTNTQLLCYHLKQMGETDRLCAVLLEPVK